MEAVLAILIATLMLVVFKVQGAWVATCASIGGFGFFVYMVLLVLKWLFNWNISFPVRTRNP
jgi:hypothetical protein